MKPPLAAAHPDPIATFGEALRAAATAWPDREAYVDGTERMDYATWNQRSDAMAAALHGRSVGRGDVVALMLPSGTDFAVAAAAVLKLGAVVTGLSTRLGRGETEAILERCRAKLVIHSPAGAPAPDGYPLLMSTDLTRIYRQQAVCPVVSVARTDPAVIIWTSGTTGAPKGAWFDHKNLEAAVVSAGIMSRPFDRKLMATPFAHAGYMAKLWDQVAWGTTVILNPQPWNVHNMLDSMESEAITVASGVPTQWWKALQELQRNPRSFPHLRLATAATAPASPELVEGVREVLGVPLVVRYAATESPSISGTSPQDPPETAFRTVGRPQPGLELRIGSGQEAGMPGPIEVHGDCVMRGYWNDADRTAQTLDSNGWLRTGDIGYIDDDGNLVLSGRSTEMYIRGGYNIYPLEVENVLNEHPLVGRSAVVGRATPVIGEIGVAFVQPADREHPPALDDLRAWVRTRLADYKAPDELVLVDALPLTPMLKVDKRELSKSPEVS